MPIQETIREVLDELSLYTDPLARLECLVDQARAMPALPEQDKTEANRIEGCMAQLWMSARFENGVCRFQCDSDSMVVKSIAGLLCRIYDGVPPRQILENSPEFLAEAGITSHLSANRRNALTRVWARIRSFAEKNRTP